jgi:hypothetical protein
MGSEVTSMRSLQLRWVPILVPAVLLLWAGTAPAQETEHRIQGTIGIGGTWIDETGDRSLVRERADLFEGMSIRDVTLHALGPGSLRVDLLAPRIDPVGRDVRLLVYSPLASGSLRTARNEFIYDAQGALQSQREQLTGDLRLRPVRHLELFGEGAKIDLGGRRQAILPGDEGELGTSWDQDTEMWRGGARLDGWRSTLEVASLGRTIESRSAPSADRALHGFEATLRTQPRPRLSAEALYAWSQTRILADGTPLQSDRVSARADVELRPGLQVGPIGRFEESSDLTLGVRSYIWAVGGAVRTQNARGWGDLEAEWGRRDTNVGDSDVWGVRAAAGTELKAGLRLQGVYDRHQRDRQGFAAPVAPAAPLPGLIGHLEVQRVEGRLRYRAGNGATAEALVGRFDKNYDDVQVEQQTWRYGLQGSVLAADGLRVEAGWRLDDTFDTRTTGRYDLRTHIVFAGADLTRIHKLALHVRADAYSMQRSLDEWKLLASASAEYEVATNLFCGAQYARDQYENDIDPQDYRANVWSFTLRHAFGL